MRIDNRSSLWIHHLFQVLCQLCILIAGRLANSVFQPLPNHLVLVHQLSNCQVGKQNLLHFIPLELQASQRLQERLSLLSRPDMAGGLCLLPFQVAESVIALPRALASEASRHADPTNVLLLILLNQPQQRLVLFFAPLVVVSARQNWIGNVGNSLYISGSTIWIQQTSSLVLQFGFQFL